MKKGIARIKILMINYLASGGIQRSRAKVGWIQCCQSCSQGGINPVNLEDTVIASIDDEMDYQSIGAKVIESSCDAAT